MRLSQVVLFARDVGVLRAFYVDRIGLSVLSDEPGFVRLDAGGCALALHAVPPAIAARIVIADPPVPRADQPTKLAFHSDDVDAARAALAAAGVPMREVVRFGEVRYCDGVDPEGNVFQITSR